MRIDLRPHLARNDRGTGNTTHQATHNKQPAPHHSMFLLSLLFVPLRSARTVRADVSDSHHFQEKAGQKAFLYVLTSPYTTEQSRLHAVWRCTASLAA
jgi:hypothetical protein